MDMHSMFLEDTQDALNGTNRLQSVHSLVNLTSVLAVFVLVFFSYIDYPILYAMCTYPQKAAICTHAD